MAWVPVPGQQLQAAAPVVESLSKGPRNKIETGFSLSMGLEELPP